MPPRIIPIASTSSAPFVVPRAPLPPLSGASLPPPSYLTRLSQPLRRPYSSQETKSSQDHDPESTQDAKQDQTEEALDPDSLQAKLIQALGRKYQPPPVLSGGYRSSAAPTTGYTGPKLSSDTPNIRIETPRQAQEVVSQVVADSLGQADQAGAAVAAAIIDGDSPGQVQVKLPPKEGTHEGGRFLPKTPDNQPWAAKYVRPSHAGSQPGDAVIPSIYYGKFLRSSSSSGGGTLKSTTQRLKDLGVNAAALPLDDAKAMRAVKEGIRRFERARRVSGARHGAWQYKTQKYSEADIAQLQAELEAEVAKAQERGDEEGSNDSHTTTMGRNMPESQDSSRSPGGGKGGSGMSIRRWTSIADERIEAARAAGFFKENKLRGKPLVQDLDELNPYLGQEEFLMNRMIKRQNASPPWVELNNTFYSHLHSFRSKLVDSFTRRAVRSLTRSGALLSSSGPGTGSQGTEADRRSYFTSLAKSYRDSEWESSERGYHEETIKDINATLRRHNNICPPTARRTMVERGIELNRCYEDSVETIAAGLEEAWLEQTGQKPKASAGAFEGFGRPSAERVYDLWGNPVDKDGSGSSSSWGLTGLFSRSANESSALNKAGGGGGGDDDDGVVSRGLGREEDKEAPSQLGLVQRVKQWVLGRRGDGDPSQEARR